MEFTKKLILTGIEQRNGKNGMYTLITVLLPNGKTEDLLYKGEGLDYTALQKMQEYEFKMEVLFGKYTNVVIKSIA